MENKKLESGIEDKLTANEEVILGKFFEINQKNTVKACEDCYSCATYGCNAPEYGCIP